MKRAVNYFYFWAGLVMLLLAKIKHKLQGYRTPKPFSMKELERCIDYDVRTVAFWRKHLAEYTGIPGYLLGRRVLELGPGSDLGAGLGLLSEGAAQYIAIDVNDLATKVPRSFYESLIQCLGEKEDAGALRKELEYLAGGEPARLHYVVRDDFDLVAAMAGKKADVIFSQAAFEHFDDVQRTISQLTTVASEDAVLVMSIDLQTHSRWIRDKDPNNIYRYPAWLYGLMHFDGIPNRVRPEQYRTAFTLQGWSDIVVRPLTSLTDQQMDRIRTHLDRKFRNAGTDMACLTMLFCARRGCQERAGREWPPAGGVQERSRGAS